MAEGRIASLRKAFEDRQEQQQAANAGAPKAQASPPSAALGDLPARPDTPYAEGKAPAVPAWQNTIESLENLDGTADAHGSQKGPNKDRNLSGIVTATSKALKAALMENEELQARIAELEAKLATGGADDTDAGQIEQALSDASAALAARRQDISVLEQQVATLQADNAVMHETQMRLQAAVTSHNAEDGAAHHLTEQVQQLSSEIVDLRAANLRLDTLYNDLLLVCDDAEAQRDALQLRVDHLEASGGSPNRSGGWAVESREGGATMFGGLATINEGSGQTSPADSAATSPVAYNLDEAQGGETMPDSSETVEALRRELQEIREQQQVEREAASTKHAQLEGELDAASRRIQQLLAEVKEGQKAKSEVQERAKEVDVHKQQIEQLLQQQRQVLCACTEIICQF
jgi:chromosome segregation ATPase